MPLRFALEPFDEIYIGKCVLKNSHERASFTVEGHVPILQGKDVLSPERADSSLEQLYCCVQKMYLEDAHKENHGSYLALTVRSLTENATLASELQTIDQLVAGGQHYRALKTLKKLIGSEVFAVDQRPPANYVPRPKRWKKAQ